MLGEHEPGRRLGLAAGGRDTSGGAHVCLALNCRSKAGMAGPRRRSPRSGDPVKWLNEGERITKDVFTFVYRNFKNVGR